MKEILIILLGIIVFIAGSALGGWLGYLLGETCRKSKYLGRFYVAKGMPTHYEQTHPKEPS